MKRTILVFLLATSLSELSWAQADGKTLHDAWQAYKNPSPEAALQIGIYLGYLSGSVDQLYANPVVSKKIAFPDGLFAEQVANVVGSYLDAHPEEWNQPAAVLVVKALMKAWPRR